MSKSKKAPTMSTQHITDYQNFWKNYDTGNVDNVLNSLTNYASTSAEQNLPNMGNYNFSVDASENARKEAQNATYNAYIDRLMPRFENQTSDLQTRLVNQGLSVGSEAYQRAMNDLQDNQNDALNQATYQSVLAGNDAFSQNLQDQIAAGNFGNSAQQSYINQLLSALQGSASGVEKAGNLYSIGSAKAQADYNNALVKAANKKGGLGGALSGAISGGMAGLATGNPYVALAGAGLGAYQGYNS